jgi:hypothetical protein
MTDTFKAGIEAAINLGIDAAIKLAKGLTPTTESLEGLTPDKLIYETGRQDALRELIELLESKVK